MNIFLFSITLFVSNCTSHPKTDSVAAKSTDTLPEIIDSTSHKENVNKVVRGKLLFQLDASQFFKEGAINDIGYGETSLKYLMPLSFYKDSNYFYIPDRSRLSLRVLDAKGKSSGSFKIPLKDFTFYKTEKIFSDWYLLDIYKGLTVLDKDLKLKYQNENSVDFYFDQGLGNVYIENSLKGNRALLDQHGILKTPFEESYMDCYVNNSILSGISIYNDSIYSIIRWDLTKGSKMDSIPLSVSCRNCFILPSLLDEDLVLSSSDKPSLMDQVSIINRSSLSVVNYALGYPLGIKNLISDESAGFTYSGFIYFYDRPSKILYSLCTDQNTIKVFSFDLNNLKQ